MAFRVARQLLRERNQVLPLKRHITVFGISWGVHMIRASAVVIGNLYYNLAAVNPRSPSRCSSPTACDRRPDRPNVGAAADERIK